MNSIYYAIPFQVIFLRPDIQIPTYELGIVYHENVMAARDGRIFSTKEILMYSHKNGIDLDYAIVEDFNRPIPISE